jgi:hypothetical protein
MAISESSVVFVVTAKGGFQSLSPCGRRGLLLSGLRGRPFLLTLQVFLNVKGRACR